MGIDKHLILTLKRSVQRHRAVLGGSLAMQTPYEKIKFVVGHDNKDFDDDAKAIALAAEMDGFPYVHQFAMGLKDEVISQSVGGVAQAWNYARILRYIARGDETCLITWDDRILSMHFPFTERIVTELQSRDEEFYLLQLRVRVGDAYYLTPNYERIARVYPELMGDKRDQQQFIKLMETDFGKFMKSVQKKWDSEYDYFVDDHYIGNEMSIPIEKYVDKYFQKNMIGYDEMFVISPKGAAWLLMEAMNMEILDPKDEKEGIPYWETVLNRRGHFDCWIISDTKPAVNKAIRDGKGIYCPKSMAYRYVRDWMPMGSDVEWANKEHEGAEKLRTTSTKIPFLDIP